MNTPGRARRFPRITFSQLVSVVGLALITLEGVTHGPERPSLYVLYAGMIGLPLIPAMKKRGD